MIKWINSNLHTDLIKYITDPPDQTTNNTRRAKSELINQGVKTNSIQYNNTHQELIISNIVTESDIYNNNSYISCVNWEIEKTPENQIEEGRVQHQQSWNKSEEDRFQYQRQWQ